MPFFIQSRTINGLLTGLLIQFALVSFSGAVEANHLFRGFQRSGVASIDNATIAYHNGNLEAALAGYTRAINSRQLGRANLAIAYFDRAIVFSDLAAHEDAIADYSRAIDLAPDVAAFYLNRGNSFHQLGDDINAVSDYNEAQFLAPDIASIYHNRGNALTNLDAFADAVDDYDRAIALDPDLAVAYSGRGRVLRILGDFNRSLADYLEARDIDPSFNVAFDVGYIYFFRQEFASAEAEFASLCDFGCDLYESLGRYLALSQLDGGAIDQLADDVAGQDLDRWPGPVVAFLLGRVDSDRLLDMAQSVDPLTQRERLTMATFFLAQEALAAGDEDGAIGFFGQTINQELIRWPQFTGASEGLRMLGVDP